jgi:hypothetical protein
MKILAVDPDSAGGWALVSCDSVGALKIVSRSAVEGLAGCFAESPSSRAIYALIRDLGHIDVLVVEYVSLNRGTSVEVLRKLHEMAQRWVVVGELLVGDVARIQPQAWRNAVGLPARGRKTGALKKAIRDIAARMTINIDPKKAALREKGLNPYQDSESDAVCMAVAYFLGQGKNLDQDTEGDKE